MDGAIERMDKIGIYCWGGGGKQVSGRKKGGGGAMNPSRRDRGGGVMLPFS